MPCDLQQLLASAADPLPATLAREPSVSECILGDSLRVYEEMERQRRQWRAVGLGMWPGATDAEMDAVELMRRMETRFIQEAEQRRQEEREKAWLQNTIFGGALAQASRGHLVGLDLGLDDPLRGCRVLPRSSAPKANLTINIHVHPRH